MNLDLTVQKLKLFIARTELGRDSIHSEGDCESANASEHGTADHCGQNGHSTGSMHMINNSMDELYRN